MGFTIKNSKLNFEKIIKLMLRFLLRKTFEDKNLLTSQRKSSLYVCALAENAGSLVRGELPLPQMLRSVSKSIFLVQS